MDRRNFLKLGGAAGAGLLVPWPAEKAFAASAKAAAAAKVNNLTRFTELLPIKAPGTYSPVGTFADTTGATAAPQGVSFPMYNITASQGTAFPHAMLTGGVPIFGYGGSWPSATIEARSSTPGTADQAFFVKWVNQLPAQHILAASIDHGLGPNAANGNMSQNYMGIWGLPNNRIATHLHGGHVPYQSDGGPKYWYTPDGTHDGAQFYHGDTYWYPNNQRAATLWFHDHAMGITRINVYAGMAGFYILRDAMDDALNVPKKQSDPLLPDYEYPLVFQDRMFAATWNGINYTNCTLAYPPPPEVPEFFGDTMTVNGKVWPRMKVEPRKYRFRLLNGCNARFLNMILTLTDSLGTLPINPVASTPFVQIGTDGGLMQTPATVAKLLMAPAERCDVIIDFSAFAGKFLLVYNDASTPFGNTNKTTGAIKPVLLFDVSLPKSAVVDPPLPASLDTGLQLYTAAQANGFVQRQITLDEIVDANAMLRQLLNMRGYETDANYNMVPDTYNNPDIALGSSEQWVLVNTTVDVHPIHMHQAMFQIISRQAFDTKAYAAARAAAAPGTSVPIAPYLLGAAVAPAANEKGWKDTVRANPGEVTKIAAPFVDYAGDYVAHCHILEHEEHDMMLPLTIK